MRYEFNIWNLISKAFDALILLLIPVRILSMRKSIRKPAPVLIFVFALLTVIVYGADFLFYPVPFWITLILSLSAGLISVELLCNGPLYLKTVLIGTCVSTTMTIHLLSGSILMPFGISLFSPQMTFFPLVLYLALAFFMVHYATVPKTSLPPSYGMSMAIVMIILTMFTNIGMLESFESTSVFVRICIYLTTLGVIFYIYFLFFRIIGEYEDKTTALLMNRQIQTQKQHLEESRHFYEEMQKLRHELKNHIFYMQTLLSQNRLEELKSYFKDVYHQEYGIDLINAGCDTINTLLNQKITYADSKQIPIRVICSTNPDSFIIREDKLCTIISNLLDNAIEACEKVENPSISFSMHDQGSYLYLMCQNTVVTNIEKINPELQTTKTESGHGIGLPLIQDIVNEYDGMMEHHMEEDSFVLSLMLHKRTLKERNF